MKSDNSNTSLQDQRLQLFEDTDVLRRVPAAEAKSLSPKAKDCQRQLNEASSVWAIDGKKFLFVFAKKSDGDQKVTVWGIKKPGEYQRIKTVLVANDDDIFEAIPVFLIEYFELFILTATYSSDVRMLHDIEDKLKEAARYTPSHLKQKIKLLKAWTDILPRFNAAVASLDERIANTVVSSVNVHEYVAPPKTKGRMKAFFPAKAATYYFNDKFSVAVRKECVEFYVKLRKGHAMANVEVFSNMIRISVGCRGFADDLFGKVIKEGIDVDVNPMLTELLDNDCRYKILTDRTGEETETRFFLEIDRKSSSWLEAIADQNINREIRDMINFCLKLYNELVKSPNPSIKALADHFYD